MGEKAPLQDRVHDRRVGADVHVFLFEGVDADIGGRSTVQPTKSEGAAETARRSSREAARVSWISRVAAKNFLCRRAGPGNPARPPSATWARAASTPEVVMAFSVGPLSSAVTSSKNRARTLTYSSESRDPPGHTVSATGAASRGGKGKFFEVPGVPHRPQVVQQVLLEPLVLHEAPPGHVGREALDKGCRGQFMSMRPSDAAETGCAAALRVIRRDSTTSSGLPSQSRSRGETDLGKEAPLVLRDEIDAPAHPVAVDDDVGNPAPRAPEMTGSMAGRAGTRNGTGRAGRRIRALDRRAVEGDVLRGRGPAARRSSRSRGRRAC